MMGVEEDGFFLPFFQEETAFDNEKLQSEATAYLLTYFVSRGHRIFYAFHVQ